MTFTNKWGTTYPESARAETNPGRAANIDRSVFDKASEITSKARSTDEAILLIHEFMKSIPAKPLPSIGNEKASLASEILGKIDLDKNAGLLPRDKVILEVAMLRSIDIPARIGEFRCDAKSPAFLSESRIASMFTLPEVTHYSTEVYTKTKGGNEGFTVKDAWIPDSSCPSYKNKCSADERFEWAVNRKISGVIPIASCEKIRSYDEFPLPKDLATRIGTEARRFTHILDIIDPVGD